ncbi:hypothetical protein ACH5RR_010698 [Cinchona calisaya]|uniref:HMA domain-containing protein n=1 Tax=Cinchona calisaya TaxID=153742 RepID=A0ABD3AJL3_9GENT
MYFGYWSNGTLCRSESCILKVNVHCEACKMKIVEVLSSVIGVYSVDIDAREGMAKVSGEVDPNILLKALARTGKHAELAWVKLKHPMLNRDREDYTSSYHNNHGSYGDYHNNYNYEPHPHGNYSWYKRGLHGGHSSWMSQPGYGYYHGYDDSDCSIM